MEFLLEHLIICNSEVKSPFVDYVRNENYKTEVSKETQVRGEMDYHWF